MKGSLMFIVYADSNGKSMEVVRAAIRDPG